VQPLNKILGESDNQMNATKIEYLNFTWNPLVGCSGIGCAVFDRCWAKLNKKRRLTNCEDCYDFQPHAHFERIDQPGHVKTSKRIGVCFSADFWDNGFTGSMYPWHHFINLTKQPQNIPIDAKFPDNWVQGVSICRIADITRISILRKTKAPLKIISFEPLYENIGWELNYSDVEDIDWFIIGAQTNPLIKPKSEWVEDLVNLAFESKIPVFVKNNIVDWNRKEFPEIFLSGKQI
jgi:protein gp37